MSRIKKIEKIMEFRNRSIPHTQNVIHISVPITNILDKSRATVRNFSLKCVHEYLSSQVVFLWRIRALAFEYTNSRLDYPLSLRLKGGWITKKELQVILI